MKKITIITLLLLCTAVFADNHLYSNLKHLNFSDGLGRMLTRNTVIMYNDSLDSYTVYFEESLGSTVIELDTDKIDTLVSIIEKYKEWNIKASKLKVKIEKDVGTIEARAPAWLLGKEWHFADECKMRFGFFSQSKTKHQLYISFSTMYNKYNKYSKHRPNTVYLTYKQANKLLEVFSKSKMDLFKKEVLKKKKALTLFN